MNFSLGPIEPGKALPSMLLNVLSGSVDRNTKACYIVLNIWIHTGQVKVVLYVRVASLNL
jgi:hypothetical protein